MVEWNYEREFFFSLVFYSLLFFLFLPFFLFKFVLFDNLPTQASYIALCNSWCIITWTVLPDNFPLLYFTFQYGDRAILSVTFGGVDKEKVSKNVPSLSIYKINGKELFFAIFIISALPCRWSCSGGGRQWGRAA